MEKNKTFEEQINDIREQLNSLPEDKQEFAEAILNKYAESVNETERVNKEIDDYMKANPNFDPVSFISRPEGMSQNAYKIIRRAAKESVKAHLKGKYIKK